MNIQTFPSNMIDVQYFWLLSTKKKKNSDWRLAGIKDFGNEHTKYIMKMRVIKINKITF